MLISDNKNDTFQSAGQVLHSHVYFSGDLHVRLDTITTTDVLKAIERTRPSASINKEKYVLWQKDYESI